MTAKAAAPIPVVLDTDIGTDIDDTWALALLLRSPELDPKLVTTATGDTALRARIACRLLEVAGRPDIAIGLGVRTADVPVRQAAWVEGYELPDYPGAVHADGVAALVETVMASAEPVTLIAIGPLTNVAAALAREPRIAQRARFVGMHGCFGWSHHEGHGVIAEYNVKCDVPACQAVFAAPWDKTITPLDTCGRMRLAGEKYRAARDSGDSLARAVIENERVWREAGGLESGDASSILFDTVAVYLAFSEEVLAMKRTRIRVTGDGFTREDEAGEAVNVALAWRDLAAFEDLLVERMTCGAPPS